VRCKRGRAMSKVMPVAIGMVLLLVPQAEADSEEIPAHIRAFCSLRWPEDAEKQSECDARQHQAARELLDLLEAEERESRIYIVGQKCIEQSRLNKVKKTKVQKASVDWARARRCVDSQLARQAAQR